MNQSVKYLLLAFLSTLSLFSFAQDDELIDSTENEYLNIFLDCNFCDRQYLRQNLGEVNFVRDRMVNYLSDEYLNAEFQHGFR